MKMFAGANMDSSTNALLANLLNEAYDKWKGVDINNFINYDGYYYSADIDSINADGVQYDLTGSGQSSAGSAGGGFLIYPNKPNTNMMQSVYTK
jgi:hypothetical protein